jgi:hypothetical protein
LAQFGPVEMAEVNRKRRGETTLLARATFLLRAAS